MVRTFHDNLPVMVTSCFEVSSLALQEASTDFLYCLYSCHLYFLLNVVSDCNFKTSHNSSAHQGATKVEKLWFRTLQDTKTELTHTLLFSVVFQWAPLISLIYILLSITPNGIQSESKRGRTGGDAEGGGTAGPDATHRIPTAAGRKLLLKLNTSRTFVWNWYPSETSGEDREEDFTKFQTGPFWNMTHTITCK